MEPEPGDVYIRRVSTFIRNNEKGLAEAGFVRRRRPQRRYTDTVATSVFNPVGWFYVDNRTQPSAPPPKPKPVVFTIDTHRLFYILMRLEAIGMAIGTLDVKVDHPSRPMTFTKVSSDPDKSETLSLASFRSSLTAVSGLSLGGGWWGRPEPQSIDAELRFIFSSFTKIPAILIKSPGSKMIAELSKEPPNENALPMDAFKNIQSLECVDIDPRTLLGWDKLAESLGSLTIRKSGMEDFTDLFVVSVLEDEREREERISITRRRMGSRVLPRQASFHSTLLPASVPESVEDLQTPTAENIQLPPPPLAAPQLSPSKWAFLKHLSLADNAMTFLSMEPLTCLASLTHLDLSSNLLVSVPHGLSVLHNLVSLNLSDNMIDSVLGIYTQLGQVLTINLSRNRLESLCGLERLMALERVDLRHNYIVESGEVGRLATVPNITEVWVEGNPLAYHEDNYRINCFDIFLKEGKSIQLDGTPPSFSERRTLTVAPDQIPASRSVPAVPSPSVVAVGVHTSASAPDMPSTPQLSPSASSPASRNASPMLTAVVAGKSRRKRNKRIVDLDGDADHSDASVTHSGLRSHNKPHGDSSVKASSERERPHDPPSQLSQASAETTLSPHSRHRRRNTDHSSASAANDSAPMSAHSGSLRRISRDARALSPVRRSYVSTSIYEPPTSDSATSESKIEEAEAYRARIEALRSDMGDGWLKVFSQSQLGAPTRVGRR